MTYNGLLITRYYMRFPSEEEKQQKIITTMLCDIKGCHKDNFEHIVHFENVKIIAQFPNPETYTDYKTADIAFDDNAFDDVDEDMIAAVKREIFNVLYLNVFLKQPDLKAKLDATFDIMTSDIF